MTLEKMKKTSEGKVNKRFWREIFKIHTSKSYGNPQIIDGWILTFYPYDKFGKRKDFKKNYGIELDDIKLLPSEIVSVNFYYEIEDAFGITVFKEPMEFCGGFVGLKQNKKSFCLEPNIAWFITHKDQKKEKPVYEPYHPIIYNNLTQVPDDIWELPSIDKLTLNFIGNINIPDKISTLKLTYLYLNGNIADEEIQRINKLLPKTGVFINGKYSNKNGIKTKNNKRLNND